MNDSKPLDLKPRKVCDYRGQKTWIYKGRTITSETHRKGCYPYKVRTWTSSYIDGKHHVCGGLREAVKLIDSGKLQKAQA